MGLLRTALLKASRSRWLARQVSRRRFARRAVRRFMPGEELDSALEAAERLRDHGMASVLTRLGENVTDLDEAREVSRHYLEALERIHRQSLPAHLSVKLTQLGLDISREACHEDVCRLVARAGELGTVVWIDMEGSEYTGVTLDLYRDLRTAYPNVGVCLQAYLYRTARDLEALAPLEPVIRLVKGAYRESPEIAYPRKRDVDEEYVRLARRLLGNGLHGDATPPGIATHDDRLIGRIRDEADARGVPRDRYEFQMLYGIRPEEQRRLAGEGHRVRVLISYGDAWFPWYMRRLAERPANLWFVVKSVGG